MIAHLFVYGTLMSAATDDTGRAERVRLAREGRSLGPATLPGLLYDLGRYPGLVEAINPTGLVHGEAFALADPAKSLDWLDAYEGIVPGEHADNEYARVERIARLATGASLPAWVYVLRKDIGHARLVPSGRWTRS